ncbi:hypothetical protein ACH40E_40770 [Streptomyces acidicola]|uniref:hypothetical protein n=1 Tax=Streptomyces acidicola TaxID=2596892 RepID=UPI0037A64099
MDGHRADKAFHELARPERALAETRRVLVPGGLILLVGHNWDTIVIDSADPARTRTPAQTWSPSRVPPTAAATCCWTPASAPRRSRCTWACSSGRP